MKIENFYQLIVFVLISMLASCSKDGKNRQWATNLMPSDKPIVNYVIELTPKEGVKLTRVILRGQRRNGDGFVDREMRFTITGRDKNKIFFQIEADPNEVIELAIPDDLGESFEVKVTYGTNPVEEIITFIEHK